MAAKAYNDMLILITMLILVLFDDTFYQDLCEVNKKELITQL